MSSQYMNASQSSDEESEVEEVKIWETLYEESKAEKIHDTEQLINAIRAHGTEDVRRGVRHYVYIVVVGGSNKKPKLQFVPTIKFKDEDIKDNYVIKIGHTAEYLPLRFKRLPGECGVETSPENPAVVRVLAILRKGSKTLEGNTLAKMKQFGALPVTPASTHFKDSTSKEYFLYSINNVMRAIAAIYKVCIVNGLVDSLYITKYPTRNDSRRHSLFIPASDTTYQSKPGDDTLPEFVYYHAVGVEDSKKIHNGYLMRNIYIHDIQGADRITNFRDDEDKKTEIQIEFAVNKERWFKYEFSKRLKSIPKRGLKDGQWYATLPKIKFETNTRPRIKFDEYKDGGEISAEEEEEEVVPQVEEEEEEEEEKVISDIDDDTLWDEFTSDDVPILEEEKNEPAEKPRRKAKRQKRDLQEQKFDERRAGIRREIYEHLRKRKKDDEKGVEETERAERLAKLRREGWISTKRNRRKDAAVFLPLKALHRLKI